MNEIFIRAAVCREFGAPLALETLSLAPPRAGEARVKVRACAICHSDLTYMDGGWGGKPPVVFGHEAAGVVECVGENVSDLRAGDAVLATLLRTCGRCPECEAGAGFQCAGSFAIDSEPRLRDKNNKPVFAGLRTGAFAEAVVVDASQVVRIPDLKWTSASLLSCGVLTGFGAVANTARVPALSSVAVAGCGGVGLNCVQAAALCGARPLAAIDVVEAKLKLARDFGAEHLINAKTDDAKAAALSLTEGRGFDYVFVAAGSGKLIGAAQEWLARRGTLVLAGMPPDGDFAEVDGTNIAHGGRKILGSKMGSARLRTDIPKLADLYLSGRLKLDEMISGTYPLEKINDAIADSRGGESLRNVIVFE